MHYGKCRLQSSTHPTSAVLTILFLLTVPLLYGNVRLNHPTFIDSWFYYFAATLCYTSILETLDPCCEFDTLSLDVGHVQSLFQSQDNGAELEVKGVAEKKTNR